MVRAEPKVRVQVVAETEPTVIVPERSEESEARVGLVPQAESTGAVEEAAICPYWSIENRQLKPLPPQAVARDVVAKMANIGPVVEAVLKFKRFVPKLSLI